MKTQFPIAAAFAVSAVLGACSGAAPTGPAAASLELSNSTSGGYSLNLGSTTIAPLCLVSPSTGDNTSGQIGATGTYAVAYGGTVCRIAP